MYGLGLSKTGIRRRVEAGRLHRLHYGVYAVGHVALTPRSRYLAAVLACGPAALVSHRTAGVVWGLLSSCTRIEVTAPRGRGPRPGIAVHRSRLIHPADRAVVDAIPVTSVARTLVDLAEVLGERRLANAVHEAEVLRLFDLTKLQQTLDRVPGRAGRHRLRRVLASYEPEFDPNRLQRRFLELCRGQGLPIPQAQVPIGGDTVDFFWPDAKVAVETDGAGVHHTRRAFYADRRRDRALAAVGVHVIRVTWPDLEEPIGLTRELTAILSRRG